MKDITKFCYNSDIKPELKNVYVYKQGEDLFAVATDTFRLAEWKIIDDFLKEYITPGFYTAQNWKTMCKSYNKKNQDLKTFADTIKANGVIMSSNTWSFPEYQKIIPINPGDFSSLIKVNKKFFIDFLELMPDFKFEGLCFSKIKTDGKMIIYKDETLVLILMQLSK